MNPRRWVAACLGLALTLAHSPARAEVVVFNTFSAGDDYNNSFGLPIAGASSSSSPSIFGMKFGTTENANLTKIELAASLLSGPNELLVVVAADANGEPGAVLESFSFSDAMGPLGTNHPLLVGISALQPLLQANTPYWFVVYPGDPATSAIWNSRSVPTLSQGVLSEDGGETFQQVQFVTSVVRISGEASAAVPEPAALGLWSLFGLGGLALGRRRRRGHVVHS